MIIGQHQTGQQVSDEISWENALAILLNAGYEVHGAEYNLRFGRITNTFMVTNLDPDQELYDQLVSLATLDHVTYVHALFNGGLGQPSPPGGMVVQLGGGLRTVEEIDSLLAEYGLHVLGIKQLDFSGQGDEQLINVTFDHTQYSNEEMANLLINSGAFVYLFLGGACDIQWPTPSGCA